MKKLFSLLLAALMLASFMPPAMAEVDTNFSRTNILSYTYNYAANTNNESGSDFTEMPEITSVGNGVSTGDQFYSATVKPTLFPQGASVKDILTDGYYFTYGETAWTKVLGTSERVTVDEVTGDSNNRVLLAPHQGTAKMVKLSEENSGIEFSWTTAQNVARLHLWAWPADSVKKYEIRVQTANGLETVLEGSLDYDLSESASETNSTFYSIILPETYQTTKLQFVVKELNGDAVYLTEAVPRSTNEIDLTSVNPRAVTSQILHTDGASSPSIYVDEVILGYFKNTIRTNTDDSARFFSGIYLESGSLTKQAGRTWSLSNYNWYFKSKTGGGYEDSFYAVDFGEAKQTINKVTSNTNAASSGKEISKVKLYYTDSKAAFDALKTDGNAISGWTEAGSVDRSCNNWRDHSADFSNVKAEARYWMVRFEMAADVTKSVNLAPAIGMYNLTRPAKYTAPTVTGDGVIYKTPAGTESFVEYKLLASGAEVTDATAWSLEGSPAGVSIDNAGKLKITNAASGTFNVVATTADGSFKKEVKVSDYFLFEDFEGKEVKTNDGETVSDPDKEKGGAFFGTRSGVREESAGGNKYGHGYQNLTYTTSIGSSMLACAFYGRTDVEKSFTEMHETRPQVITLEGKFRNSYEIFENPQWMFALLFNAENGKPLYGSNLNIERQANTTRIIGVESNGANEAYTLIDYNGGDGTYDKNGTKIPGIGEHSSNAWGRKYWFDARVTIDFEKQTYSLWAEDRVVFENYPLPSDPEAGKAVSLSMWAYNCDSDDVAIYSGYKNAANIPENEMIKGENGSFVIKGIVRNNNFLKVAKYENNTLAEIFDASDLSLIGKHTGTEVTIPNYDSKYQYKVFWWMPKLVPLADCIEFPAK